MSVSRQHKVKTIATASGLNPETVADWPIGVIDTHYRLHLEGRGVDKIYTPATDPVAIAKSKQKTFWSLMWGDIKSIGKFSAIGLPVVAVGVGLFLLSQKR